MPGDTCSEASAGWNRAWNKCIIFFFDLDWIIHISKLIIMSSYFHWKSVLPLLPPHHCVCLKAGGFIGPSKSYKLAGALGCRLFGSLVWTCRFLISPVISVIINISPRNIVWHFTHMNDVRCLYSLLLFYLLVEWKWRKWLHSFSLIHYTLLHFRLFPGEKWFIRQRNEWSVTAAR